MQNVIRNSVRSRVSQSHRRSSNSDNLVVASDTDRRNFIDSPSKFRRDLELEENSLCCRTSTPSQESRRDPSIQSDLGDLGDLRLSSPKDPNSRMDIYRSDSKSSHSRLYKILVLGDAGMGKTAIIRRFVRNVFYQEFRSTVGVDFHMKIIPFNDELEIRLQLWDIAGQERFTPMTRAYFRGAVGAFIVCDLSQAQSFENVSKWKKEVDEKCFLPDGKNIPTILLANKSDLERDKNMPDDVTLSQYLHENRFVPKLFKTSAISGEGIEDAMRIMVRYVMAMDTWNRSLANADEGESSMNHNAFGLGSGSLMLRSDDFKTKEEKYKNKCSC